MKYNYNKAKDDIWINLFSNILKLNINNSKFEIFVHD